jgi:CheY-like chemotaxis protein
MARILIIDDESQIRSMLRLMLERVGYEVVEAPDGIEGIRKYREKPADLIITDLIMPNKDGIGMITMSGGGVNRPEGYLDGAKKLGANRTLTKPIDRDKMLTAVKETLKESTTADETPA